MNNILETRKLARLAKDLETKEKKKKKNLEYNTTYRANLSQEKKEENKQKNIIYNKEKKEKLTEKELIDFRNSENEYRKKLRIKTVIFIINTII